MEDVVSPLYVSCFHFVCRVFADDRFAGKKSKGYTPLGCRKHRAPD